MNHPTTIIALMLICIAATTNTTAQTTGEVNFKTLGIKFIIPDGWVGQEVQGGYIIGHNTEPGFAFLTLHEYTSVAQLEQEAQQGITEQNGTNLSLSGELKPLGKQGIGGEYGGTLEGKKVKAYILGLVNPYGNGVTIMAAATPEQYSEKHKQVALQLANSIRFSKPETPPIAPTAQKRRRIML